MLFKSKKKGPPKESQVDQPKMTAFIDIIFQLLIYFMLTMKFKKEEGQILQQLPKDKGLAAAKADIEPKEVRINICVHPGKRFDQHIGLKIRHQQMLDTMKDEGQPIGDIAYVWIGDNYRGKVMQLFRTSSYSDKRGNNINIYTNVSDAAIDLQRRIKVTNPKTPIIIDADGLTPYEHVFGFLSYLFEKGITDINLAGNPKFQKN